MSFESLLVASQRLSVSVEAVANLRIVRSGGHPWTSREVEEKLRAKGFEQTEAYSPAPPILFVAGRRADRS